MGAKNGMAHAGSELVTRNSCIKRLAHTVQIPIIQDLETSSPQLRDVDIGEMGSHGERLGLG